jgi:hypothetical protein
MLHASDALRAHAQCKERLADILCRNATHSPYFCELAPHADCVMARFIQENIADPDLEPELIRVRAAHAAVHCRIIELAQKHDAGRPLDIAHEFGTQGELGAASNALVDAIWKLEGKRLSLAH